MTPTAIFEEIEALPPLWRPKFGQRLIGMDVDWAVTFGDAWESEDRNVRISLRVDRLGIRRIMGTVSLNRYPQLEQLHAGEPLRIHGRIRAVERFLIELDITELLFCVEPEPAVA